MECCVGIIVLTVIVVGGSFIYGQFAGAIMDRKRVSWARSLNNIASPELERKLYELQMRSKTLQRERLLLSGHRRASLDVDLGECFRRIKIIESIIEERVLRQRRY